MLYLCDPASKLSFGSLLTRFSWSIGVLGVNWWEQTGPLSPLPPHTGRCRLIHTITEWSQQWCPGRDKQYFQIRKNNTKIKCNVAMKIHFIFKRIFIYFKSYTSYTLINYYQITKILALGIRQVLWYSLWRMEGHYWTTELLTSRVWSLWMRLESKLEVSEVRI